MEDKVWNYKIMSYLSQSPEVYQYDSQIRPGSIIEPKVPYPTNNSVTFNRNRVETNVTYPQPPLNRFGESQVERIYKPIVAPNQEPLQYNPNQMYVNSTRPNNQNQTQVPVNPSVQISNNSPQGLVDNRMSQNANSTTNRFDKYLTTNKSYKYNLFSMIDQSWNNCLGSQKYGPFPGNECIASGPFVRQ